eukprot:TRINITY_DN1013_c0_g1_i1.p2 TRINITY_DN1013_c0_g1~~TRINITY_DN1013_c0_g1_i1.p2  ORF type:complete len:157 (+),score=97.93 TRINITY_DN1013_c0_g1_i1:556-1026(+)
MQVHHGQLKHAYYTATLSDTKSTGSRQLLATLYEDSGVEGTTWAGVRFVMLSPDAGSVDVHYSNGDLQYESLQHGFSEVSMYHHLATPGTPYEISVLIPALGKAFDTQYMFYAGRVYTVYATGRVRDGSFKVVVTSDEARQARHHSRFEQVPVVLP